MNRSLLASVAAGCLLFCSPVFGQAEAETFLLRYKLTAGQTLRYQVTHLAATKTKVAETTEETNVRTVSVKAWNVSAVNDEGEMSFDHKIESVEMTQQAGDGAEIRWNSTTDEIPPLPFKAVAERLGKVLGTVRINGQGQVLERSEGKSGSAALGMGDITLALPAEPIKIGGKWSVPREIKAKNEAGIQKPIKIREVFTLEKVETGVATISVRSEPLTPIEDQVVRSQLVQQLSNGTIRFDLDAGRLISRQLDWDDSVVGFQGPTSNMHYRARLTEELIAERPETAARENSVLTK